MFKLNLVIVSMIILSNRNGIAAYHHQHHEDALKIRQSLTNNPRSRSESINKTDMLYPEYQTPAQLQPGNVSKFYYLSHRDGHPLTLIVTPCAGEVSWNVISFEPPDDKHNDESGSLTRWPVNALIPGSPLFSYEGNEAQNFTIPRVRAGLYRLEIKTKTDTTRTTKIDRSPKTVLLYATSSALDHLPVSYESTKGKKHRILKFKSRRNNKLTVSWSRSHVDPHLSTYCLSITSGNSPHPPTLCAAKNVLQVHSKPVKGSREHRRVPPEGLHCVHQTKLTLHSLKYNTTYNFTLYLVSGKSNVSTRISTQSFKYLKAPAQILRTGHYITANLRKNDGFLKFEYRAQYNKTTEFHILPCGEGVVMVKLHGPALCQKEKVIGRGLIKAQLLPEKRYILRIYATPQELLKISSVKLLAVPSESFRYSEMSFKNAPREYLKKCHEVIVGVESAGAAIYCVTVRELNILDDNISNDNQCELSELNRRRRSSKTSSSSDYVSEECEEKLNPSKKRALLFTIKRLQPGKLYLVQITAQIHGQLISYPLTYVNTSTLCY